MESAGFVRLFTGEDLAHWRVEPGHRGHWQVEDGVLKYAGKAEQKSSFDKGLWTRKAFGDVALCDVEFYVEWCLSAEPRMKEHPIVLWNGDFLRDANGVRITRPHLDARDSGIYFRVTFHAKPIFGARPWGRVKSMGIGQIASWQ